MKNIYLILTICLLFACKKDQDVKPDNKNKTCLITRIDEQGGSYSTYQYDDNNNLKSFFEKVVSDPDNPYIIPSEFNYTIERDNKNRISKIIGSNGNFFDSRTIEYDNQGRWTKSIHSSSLTANGPQMILAISNVEYTSEGLIHKIISTNENGTFSYSLSFEYNNKNLARSVFDFSYKSTSRYEYYPDKVALPTEVDLINLYTTSGLISHGASTSRNLLKQVKSDDSKRILEELTYELNEWNYPTKIIKQMNYNTGKKTSVRTITYLCR